MLPLKSALCKEYFKWAKIKKPSGICLLPYFLQNFKNSIPKLDQICKIQSLVKYVKVIEIKVFF